MLEKQPTEQKKTIQRKDEILQVLAKMLEDQCQGRITAAMLAKEVGVSEADLYIHFHNKAAMYQGLIHFIEESLFTRINIIMKEHSTTLVRCEHLLMLILAFAEQNAGLCRILTGEALVGEDTELHYRINRLFDRLEAQIKQVLRESEIRDGVEIALPISAAASLLLAIIEGRIVQFVRSGFQRKPTQEWRIQWEHLANSLAV